MLRSRRAFTFIELIFAIVIIGVSAFSIPMMSQVISSGSEKNLVQEAVFVASTEITKVLSSQWDENSRVSQDDFEHIIFTSDLEADMNLSKRTGNINIIYNTDSNRTIRPSTLGFDANDNNGSGNREDDVDDYIVTGGDATGSSGSISGYKFKYTKNIAVTSSASFGTSVNSPNIKRIQISIHDASSSNLLVSFYMFTTNSGSVSTRPTRRLP